MKAKLSATVEAPLVRFLDSLPGKTRSEKLERALSILRHWEEERRLRQQLRTFRESEPEQREREEWEEIVEEAMWSE